MARSLPAVERTEEKSRESSGQISVASLLLATRPTQRGCVNQIICAAGNDSRKAETAGNVWTISPSELRRTTAKRISVMRILADGFKERACRMILGIANDRDANAEALGDRPLGNAFGRVVSSLCVDVGAQRF